MNDNTQSRVSIKLTGFNPTDAAVVLLSDASIDIDHEHQASISADTMRAIEDARRALAANPSWDSITVSSDMACGSLDHAFEGANTNANESFVVFSHGVYLRLFDKHVREAEIEFEVRRADGKTLIEPAQ